MLRNSKTSSNLNSQSKDVQCYVKSTSNWLIDSTLVCRLSGNLER